MGRVRETLHDVLRQTDAVLLALCVASTLYGMVLIASATSFRGTLKYVAVQGLGLLIGLVLYFFLSSIDVFELAKQWKWLLGFNVGFLLLLLTPFGQTRNGNRAWLGVNDIGKNLGADLREGKMTLPLIYARASATPEEQALIDEAVRKGDGDFDKITSIVIRSGTLDRCKTRAEQELERGRKALSQIPPSIFNSSLLELMSFTVRRDR